MTQAAEKVEDTTGKITCQICGAATHHIGKHLESDHTDVTLEEYKKEYPHAPLTSQAFEDMAKRKAKSSKQNMQATVHNFPTSQTKEKFAELFSLGKAPAAKNKRGGDIMITALGQPNEEIAPYLIDKDPNYVFDINLLKKVAMVMELNMPLLLHGMHGTGKTTLAQQFCAFTRRPVLRVQHTISTEESHLLGETKLINDETVFEYGPLPYAMKHGLVYIADEYDFALPSVIATYQPILEGQDLVIKDAPIAQRVIKPHPNFRFIATGNTNGSGDDTGLYQGTNMQNAAGYSRLITEVVGYMEPKQEELVVSAQSGVKREDARRLVGLANRIRDQFKGGEISMTISPRELINAAKLALVMGSDWEEGLKLAFVNRLSETDREAVNGYMQREFGNG